MTRVLVWNEFRHEKKSDHPAATLYPKGIHGAIAEGLTENDKNFVVKTATLDEPEHGLTEAVLSETDVLIWWGHMAHHEVQDEVVARVKKHVVERGMGLVVLHSGHFSKIFKSLMGTTCDLKWRESDDIERVWVIEPSHPIAAGVPQHFELPEEMYGERFDIPAPDNLVMVSWFTGGEVFVAVVATTVVTVRSSTSAQVMRATRPTLTRMSAWSSPTAYAGLRQMASCVQPTVTTRHSRANKLDCTTPHRNNCCGAVLVILLGVFYGTSRNPFATQSARFVASWAPVGLS